MSRRVLVPGPDHPITVEPAPGRVRVRLGEQVIADTSSAQLLSEAGYPPVAYVPLADVDPEVLVPSGTHTYCPYKGEASYYSLRGAAGEVEDAAWTYPEPYDAVAPIAGHLAFYPDRVTVEG